VGGTPGLSRGAAALSVAFLALDEVAAVMDDAICSDRPLWSARASFSAGIELTSCEVVVIGQSADWCGSLRIDHAVMSDAIDAAAVTDLLARANLTAGSALLHALLAKAEATQSGQIRGARHTMLDDSDISSTRHAGGFFGGLLAGLAGTTQIFVSGGAEHQGPDGGGPVAIIFETLEEKHP
jgi:cyanuric acid amidohydrolase